MFLYSWLHMAGYDLPLEEGKNFRQHHSMTPGHPEFPSSEHNTPGIEATTGPLGAGVSNCAGIAAHEGLDNLIVLYDANDVTLDKMAEFTQSEDVGKRYEAYGWNVITLLDGHDLKALNEAVETAKKGNGKPTLIICKTEIGR